MASKNTSRKSTNTANHNRPLAIILAVQAIIRFVQTKWFLYGRPLTVVKMRSDHAENIRKVLHCYVEHCCLARDGAFLKFNEVNGRKWARPLTIQEVADMVGLNEKTVDKILAELEDMGLMSKCNQIRRVTSNGLEVSPVIRVFTKTFWSKLGLREMYEEAVEWMRQKVQIIWHFKLIKNARLSDEARSKAKCSLLVRMTACEFRRRRRGKCWGDRHQDKEVCAFCREWQTRDAKAAQEKQASLVELKPKDKTARPWKETAQELRDKLSRQ